jgi:hypothetical protein
MWRRLRRRRLGKGRAQRSDYSPTCRSGRSAEGVGDGQLFANFDCGRILHFAMSRHCTGALRGRIGVDAMLGALPVQDAAIRFQVSDEINALQLILLLSQKRQQHLVWNAYLALLAGVCSTVRSDC